MIAKIEIDLNNLDWDFEFEPDKQLLIDFKVGLLEQNSINNFIRFILNTEFLLYCPESFSYQDLLLNKFISFPDDEFIQMKNEVLNELIEAETSLNFFTNCFVKNGLFYHPESGQSLEELNCKPCCIYIENHRFSVFILDNDDADYFINP